MGFLNIGSNGLDYEPRGDYVTKKRIKKVQDVLEDDERVQYMVRGGTIDVEGAGSGKSLFGTDRSRSSGTKGWVRTVFTDDRIVAKVPQFLGSDTKTIPYESILGVDLDTGFTQKRLSIQTAGPTYHIQVANKHPKKKECRELVSFIQSKMAEHSGGTTVEADPTEQLANLKELHDDGVVTDEEFEEKKATLLDKI